MSVLPKSSTLRFHREKLLYRVSEIAVALPASPCVSAFSAVDVAKMFTREARKRQELVSKWLL